MVSALIAVPITWKLMQISAILAMEVGLAFVCSGLFMVLFLPETLARAKASEVSGQGANSDVCHEHEELVQREQVLSIFGVLKGSNFILATPALRLLIIPFLTGPILLNSMGYILQLVSDKYNWTLAEVCSSFTTSGPDFNFYIGELRHTIQRSVNPHYAHRRPSSHIFPPWLST